MNNIEFYIPEGEKIPTKMRLRKGDIQVIYKRELSLVSDISYSFEVFNIKDEETGEAIVKEIADLLMSQSYNHGQEWRVSEMILSESDFEDPFNNGTWIVNFDIRDSW